MVLTTYKESYNTFQFKISLPLIIALEVFNVYWKIKKIPLINYKVKVDLNEKLRKSLKENKLPSLKILSSLPLYV